MAIASGDPVVIVLGADGLPVVGPVSAPASGDPVVIIIGADGLPVAVAGGVATNPCDPDPEMLLTVTGTTGTINWCGQTWVLPGDSGVQKSVCADTYILTRGQTTSVGGVKRWFATHAWNIPGQLSIGRAYSLTSYLSSFGRAAQGNANAVAVFGSGDRKEFFLLYPAAGPRPVLATATYVVSSLMNLILGVGEPLYSDYNITDAFFGSYVTGGVTYTWAKGQGW